MIYESTTTTHTTTTRTVKVNRGNIDDAKIDFFTSNGGGLSDKTELLKRICKNW